MSTNHTDADVVVVGAGPTGLMLAAELGLAGVRPVVIERHPEPRTVARAGGLGGRILELLRHRGLLDPLRALADDPDPAPRFPFGGVHVDLTGLADAPMHAIAIPQARLERLLDDRARELGADVRRGHEVWRVTQDTDAMTVGTRDGERLTARWVVGCDGPRSAVRTLAGIAFPGTTYPEVNRLARVTVPGLPDGDLDVHGVGRLSVGFTRTAGGVFGYGGITDGVLFANTVEDELVEYDDDQPMALAEFGDSVRRVLGVELPMGTPLRLSRWQFQARQAERYRDRRVFLAGDAAHLLPATGAALNLGLLDAVNLAWKLAAEVHGWAPGPPGRRPPVEGPGRRQHDRDRRPPGRRPPDPPRRPRHLGRHRPGGAGTSPHDLVRLTPRARPRPARPTSPGSCSTAYGRGDDRSSHRWAFGHARFTGSDGNTHPPSTYSPRSAASKPSFDGNPNRIGRPSSPHTGQVEFTPRR
ncbi:FAD-dependent monooxygenase [Cryptosporangium arvum]|uniref:2-polyprenyl-6-methoxyphenol hydroxylase-like oxidoreductase n=1 Tax=Cryptosporangium arvum DSM 44712 TaxID=927661 RepID=A0A010ZT58_9ACTN|nr:FAD-dependent monooxygenase [Cryptosporangium arvum]EXG81879.1 2-polyprenyl-6-methoxyphenol hydroxylase-like oxidoreductase [Cryptosporangium arvum DSM 44712]